MSPMNPRLLSPRQLQSVPIYTARMGAKFLDQYNAGGQVSSSATTANAVGGWLQIFSNTAIPAGEEVCWLAFGFAATNHVVNGNQNGLIDIGTGPAGSETVVVANIPGGAGVNTGGGGQTFILPVRIPGATRIAVRYRAALTSRNLMVLTAVAAGRIPNSAFADQLPTTAEVLGTNTATSSATAMTGASGTWTEITPGTTKEYQALVLVFGGDGSSTVANISFRLDLGIGPQGQEQPIAWATGSTRTDGGLLQSGANHYTAIFGGLIPIGTRIAVRHNLASNPGCVSAGVIGVPFP